MTFWNRPKTQIELNANENEIVTEEFNFPRVHSLVLKSDMMHVNYFDSLPKVIDVDIFWGDDSALINLIIQGFVNNKLLIGSL